MSSAAAVTTATNIQKLFGSNYYTASRILPKAIRDDVIVFYAFVRLADEIVDNPQPGTDPANELQTFIDDWEKAFVGTPVQNTILQAFSEVCQRREIPFSLTYDFLCAMHQDLTVKRYETYTDLQTYMYGSAEVIGLILLKIFGCDEAAAEKPARALGEAMQFTNFLRDIYEDFHDRNRIYIPLADLRERNLSEADLLSIPSSQAIRSLLEFEAGRAEKLYAEAIAGISLLPKTVQPAVRAAAGLYLEILHEFARAGYIVQEKKIRFSKLKKLKIALLYAYVRK